jgi:hypothetical protein
MGRLVHKKTTRGRFPEKLTTEQFDHLMAHKSCRTFYLFFPEENKIKQQDGMMVFSHLHSLPKNQTTIPHNNNNNRQERQECGD